MLIELLKSILIGIVQGITEWLPISSTGHMLLLDELISLNVSDAFRNLFLVLIQLGSILAVIVLYFRRLNPFAPSKSPTERKSTWNLWGKVVVGSVPVAILGFLLDDLVEEKLSVPAVIAAALIVYGVLFLVIERLRRGHAAKIRTVEELSYPTAFFVGAFQALSIIPGTSRSGSTILGAMILGVDRTVAAEFSFFLAIPAMLGASLLRLAKFLLGGFSVTGGELAILFAGTLVAFLVSLCAIRFLMRFVSRHGFSAFGWYRIALGVLVILFLVLLPALA